MFEPHGLVLASALGDCSIDRGLSSGRSCNRRELARSRHSSRAEPTSRREQPKSSSSTIRPDEQPVLVDGMSRRARSSRKCAHDVRDEQASRSTGSARRSRLVQCDVSSTRARPTAPHESRASLDQYRKRNRTEAGARSPALRCDLARDRAIARQERQSDGGKRICVSIASPRTTLGSGATPSPNRRYRWARPRPRPQVERRFLGESSRFGRALACTTVRHCIGHAPSRVAERLHLSSRTTSRRRTR